MRRCAYLLLTLLPLGMAPGRGEAGPPPFSEDEVRIAKAIFPAFDAASRKTGERGEGGDLFLVSVESTRWKRGPDGTLIVAATVSPDPSARYSEDDCPADHQGPEGHAVVAAVRKTNGPVFLLGRADQPVSLCGNANFSLDTAPYRISESEYAFAVRQQTTYGSRIAERFHLYRLLPDAAAIRTPDQATSARSGEGRRLLVRILETDWPVYDLFIDYKVVVEPTREQANGFFKLQQLRKQESAVPDASRTKPQVSVFATYVWDAEAQAYRPVPK